MFNCLASNHVCADARDGWHLSQDLYASGFWHPNYVSDSCSLLQYPPAFVLGASFTAESDKSVFLSLQSWSLERLTSAQTTTGVWLADLNDTKRSSCYICVCWYFDCLALNMMRLESEVNWKHRVCDHNYFMHRLWSRFADSVVFLRTW